MKNIIDIFIGINIGLLIVFGSFIFLVNTINKNRSQSDIKNIDHLSDKVWSQLPDKIFDEIDADKIKKCENYGSDTYGKYSCIEIRSWLVKQHNIKKSQELDKEYQWNSDFDLLPDDAKVPFYLQKSDYRPDLDNKRRIPTLEQLSSNYKDRYKKQMDRFSFPCHKIVSFWESHNKNNKVPEPCRRANLLAKVEKKNFGRYDAMDEYAYEHWKNAHLECNTYYLYYPKCKSMLDKRKNR